MNQAIAIAKLGGEVSFLGALGKDNYGNILRSELEENGVSFVGIQTELAPTGIAMITVVDGDNFIILNPGANSTLTPEIIRQRKELLSDCTYCVLQLEIPVETVMEICNMAKENGTKIVLNPAPYKNLPECVYSLVDYLIPNEYEAQALTGICINSRETAMQAVENIRAKGVKNVVITLGENGCVYNDGEEICFRSAEKVTAVDTTSAGDCFIGALIAKLSENKPMTEAIGFATKASAITVSREGASKSIPYANEIK